MASNHYQTLGVRPTATPAEVRSAYRRLVLRHHPDRSKDPASPEKFMAATAAYDVLSDPLLRLRYDESLEAEAKRHAAHEAAERKAEASSYPGTDFSGSAYPGSAYSGSAYSGADYSGAAYSGAAYSGAVDGQPAAAPRSDSASIAADLQRLTTLFAQGRLVDAERLARTVIKVAPRTPLPYAVLGDIARARGDVNETAKMYAYATQFEPGNALYQQRYEEIVATIPLAPDRRKRNRIGSEDRKILAPLAAGVFVFCSAWYLLLFDGGGPFATQKVSSSWTTGLVMCLLCSGIAVGASLAGGNMLDRLYSLVKTTAGGLGPILALALVAMLNFWAAVLLYVMVGFFQQSFNSSTNRLLASSAAALVTLWAAFGLSGRDASSVLGWGGNLVYFGAMLGWAVADAFRTLP